ncbi:hypothetical protein PIB30_001126 [Stylosanthes scabra]|uniref:C2H2-type domain-containing protein n=1 Tax=Stylosanthes scabra TaxID=79078 RepID=A0ABU6U269_9FABA|nr:hypothetical protein [Stylosanthes scabra]
MDFHSNLPTPMGRCSSDASATNSPAPRENWWLESCHTCYHFAYARRELVPHRQYHERDRDFIISPLTPVFISLAIWHQLSSGVGEVVAGVAAFQPPILPWRRRVGSRRNKWHLPIGAGELE